jgi:hypothetical protein
VSGVEAIPKGRYALYTVIYESQIDRYKTIISINISNKGKSITSQRNDSRNIEQNFNRKVVSRIMRVADFTLPVNTLLYLAERYAKCSLVLIQRFTSLA